MKYFCVLPHCYVKTNGDSVLIINPQTKQYVYSTSSTIVESFVKNKDSYSYCIFDENDEFYLDAISGKSSVSCPLKPSDSAPLKHSTMPP